MKKETKHLILGIALGVIAIFVIILIVSASRNATGGVINQNCKEVEVPYEEIEEYTETVPYTEEICNMKDAYNYIIEIKEENIHLVDGQIGVDIHVKHNYGQTYFYIDYEVYCDGDYKTEPTFIHKFATEWYELNYDNSYFIGDYFDASITDLTNCKLKVIDAKYKECNLVTKYGSVTKTRTVTKYKTETVCE